VNIARVEELVATGAPVIGTALSVLPDDVQGCAGYDGDGRSETAGYRADRSGVATGKRSVTKRGEMLYCFRGRRGSCLPTFSDVGA